MAILAGMVAVPIVIFSIVSKYFIREITLKNLNPEGLLLEAVR